MQSFDLILLIFSDSFICPTLGNTTEANFSILSVLIAEKEPRQTKQTKPSKFSKRSWRVSAASTQQRREESMHRRHPFALYGSGEKDASMAGRKTHNVCPAASTREVSFLGVPLCDKVALWLNLMGIHLLLSLVDPRICSSCQDQTGSGTSDPNSEGRVPESQIC